MSDREPLFAASSEAEIEDALSVWVPMEAAPGELLMRQSDQDPALVYILDGMVEILRDGFTIDTSGPGEILGEISLFSGQPRIATVRAIVPTRFLVVDREAYETVRNRSNSVAFQLERLVLHQQAHRLRRLDRLVSEHAEGAASPWYKPKKTFLQRWSTLFAREAPVRTAPAPKLDVQGVLGVCPMFAGEPWALVRGLADAWRTEKRPAGDFVCAQGEPGSAMYVIARGAVEVVVGVKGDTEGARVQRLATLGPGDPFGLTGLYDGRPRAASCVATEEVDLLVLDRERWDELFAANNQVGSAMRRAAIRAFGAQLQDVGAAYLQAVGAMGSAVAPWLPTPEPSEPEAALEELDLDAETGEDGPATLVIGPAMVKAGPALQVRAARPDDAAEPPLLVGARLEMLRKA